MSPTLLYQFGKAQLIKAFHGITEVFLCNLFQIAPEGFILLNHHGGIRFNSCKQEVFQSSVMDKQFTAAGIVVGTYLTVSP